MIFADLKFLSCFCYRSASFAQKRIEQTRNSDNYLAVTFQMSRVFTVLYHGEDKGKTVSPVRFSLFPNFFSFYFGIYIFILVYFFFFEVVNLPSKYAVINILHYQ